MSVPFLSPGQTDAEVPRMKQALVPELLALGLEPIAQKINVESTTYGPTAVNGVRKFQEAKKLKVDGFVGRAPGARSGCTSRSSGAPRSSILPRCFTTAR